MEGNICNSSTQEVKKPRESRQVQDYISPHSGFQELGLHRKTILKHKNTKVGEMAEQVKVLVIKPDDLSLIPGTHMVHGKN